MVPLKSRWRSLEKQAEYRHEEQRHGPVGLKTLGFVPGFWSDSPNTGSCIFRICHIELQARLSLAVDTGAKLGVSLVTVKSELNITF